MALNGGLFDQLLTYWESTGPRYMKPLRTFINDATLNTYTTRRIQTGRNLKEIVRHGSTLKERVFLTAAKKFKRVGIDPEYTYEYKDVGVDIEVKWSIALDDITLNELALDLNAEMFRPEALAHIFKSYSEQQWMQLWTDVENSLEAEWHAVPDRGKMEVSGGNAEAPYSLHVFSNEYPNGLPQASDQPNGAWTTVQSLAPTDARTGGNWDCQRVGYAYDGSETANENTRQIFTAMSKLWHYCQFDPFPYKPEYSDKMSTPHFIGTQLDGVLNFEHALRVNQDQFRGKQSGQDPAYPGPTFMDIPVQWLQSMDTAAIYPTAAGDALSTYDDTNGAHGINTTLSDGSTQSIGHAGPRYKFINGVFLKCIWHASHFLRLRKIQDIPNRPFSKAQLVSMMNNNMCFSRRRQGELFPTGDVVNAA